MGRAGTKAKRLGLAGAAESDLFEKKLHLHASTDVLVELPVEFDPRIPERSYCDTVPISHRKRFAQFFTPVPIAQFMVDWVFETKPKNVLDPSVGPGVFLRLTQNEHTDAEMTGVDIDPVALSAARASLHPDHLELERDDFLTWKDDRKFDAILANPPYLRHHDMHYEMDIFQQVGTRGGVSLTKLTNMYVLFILEICRRLAEGGRAAVIVPGEWTNANFGMPLKRFLLERGLLHSLVYFSNMSEKFEDALTTAAILLLERPAEGGTRKTLDTYFVENAASMPAIRNAVWNRRAEENIIHWRFNSADLIRVEKWDKVLRAGLAEERSGFVPIGSIAKSRRGIATGANEYFHIPLVVVKSKGIRLESTKPCVGRAEQVKGLIFTLRDFEDLETAEVRTRLLDFPSVLTGAEKQYVDAGVVDGLHERYLLAARKPWYSMEKRPPAPIWAAVFGRNNLRFVFNEAGVSNLTTFHCLYPQRTDANYCKALVACLNSRLVQEMAEHQRRVYGGGLLKYEPKDLLSIRIPDLSGVSEKVIESLAAVCTQLDLCLRSHGHTPESLMDELDALVMRSAASVIPQSLF
ncbi:HsdM family class I SAM-dependent methyltransferase [Paracidovorax avenae]|uniref:HsdM family class I SAM-dependent methyltransferase n=1 Tax=Paracidovorax avenae TaxID=80867 RepID=UPI000D218767|nr:N-6 DNA methylase [Paracidovorax avenae]AVT12053.1 hypothetical protein C8235_03530 [Paracidovorax avenae]